MAGLKFKEGMAHNGQIPASLAGIKSKLLRHSIKIVHKFQERHRSDSQLETRCHLNLGHFAGTFNNNKTTDSVPICLILNQLK